jgi:hypothetical protein
VVEVVVATGRGKVLSLFSRIELLRRSRATVVEARRVGPMIWIHVIVPWQPVRIHRVHVWKNCGH